MLDVHLYVHGRGRGHASRANHLIAALVARGHRVRVFAGSDALPVLDGNTDTTAVASIPRRLGATGAVTLWRRVAGDLARNRASAPDVVISDGDLPSLCAARLTGIPSIALGHGLVFWSCRRPTGLPRLAWWREAIKAGVASFPAQRRIATHFGVLPLRRPGTILARPPMRRWELGPRGDVVVCYFRDGLDAAALAVLGELAGEVVIFAPGGGRGVTPPSAVAFDAAIRRASAVIATAGSQLIAECAAHGIPLLAMYRADDDEQRLNAALVQAGGHGRGAPLTAIGTPVLAEFLSWARRSPRRATLPETDGVAAVVEACESLATGPR